MATIGQMMKYRGLLGVPPFGLEEQGAPAFPMLPAPGGSPPFNPAAPGPGMMGGLPAIMQQAQGLDPSGITVNPVNVPAIMRNINQSGERSGSAAIGSFPKNNGLLGMPDLPRPMVENSSPPQSVDDLTQARAPYDYNAEVERMLGPEKKRGTLRDIIGTIADAFSTIGGGQANYWNHVSEQRDERQKLKRATLRDLIQANLRVRDPYSLGRDRFTYNPETGQNTLIEDGPEDFEIYAKSLGLEPGSDAYHNAQEDFVLRGHGPTAFQRGKDMDDYRTSNDERMEGIRAANRARVKSQPTYRDLNPPPPRTGGSGGRRGNSVPTATGPGGKQIFYRGGKWVDAQGRAVQ